MLEKAYQILQYGNYPDLTGMKKILVIKHRHLGDLLLTTPVFAILKKKLPQATIDAYIYKDTYPILEGNPHIRKYFFANRETCSKWQKLKEDITVYRHIRSEGYDLVINLTEGDRGALAAFFSKAPIKVGYFSKKGFAFKNKIFTHLVKLPKTKRHTVETHLDSLRQIGLFPEVNERSLELIVQESAKKRVKEILSAYLMKDEPFLLIHPASRWKFKCLAEKTVAALLDHFARTYDIKVVMSASHDSCERSMCYNIEKMMQTPLINLAGLLTLQELAALIDLSKVIVSVDSLPLHMASALKKPSIIFFGPSDERVWGPWMNPNARIIASNISCRPCGMDGCGGSKRSDCLDRLAIGQIDSLFKELNLFGLK